MTIFPSRMEGKIAINLRERWKNENSIGISVNKGFALLRSLVTTLPLFLDKVTFRVISPSISPQEIWLLTNSRGEIANSPPEKFSRLLLIYCFFFPKTFSRTNHERIGEESLLDRQNVESWSRVKIADLSNLCIRCSRYSKLLSFPWITDFAIAPWFNTVKFSRNFNTRIRDIRRKRIVSHGYVSSKISEGRRENVPRLVLHERGNGIYIGNRLHRVCSIGLFHVCYGLFAE